MDGKKAVIIYVGLILVIVIAIVVAMQVFFHTYEPKEGTKTVTDFIQFYRLSNF